MAVVLPFESSREPSIELLSALVRADLERVNALILTRTGSEVAMIPEVANHLISSGGKRLRPMLTLATAALCGYRGDGQIKLAASVEFMHTATLLHDDVVDQSEMLDQARRAHVLGQTKRACWSAISCSARRSRYGRVGSLRALEILSARRRVIAEGEVMKLAAAKNLDTTEDAYLAAIGAKTAECSPPPARSAPCSRAGPGERPHAARSA